MKIEKRRRIRQMIGAVTAGALALVGAVTVTQPAAAEELPAPPEIVRSVSDAGFAHPGVGFTADHLICSGALSRGHGEAPSGVGPGRRLLLRGSGWSVSVSSRRAVSLIFAGWLPQDGSSAGAGPRV